ncbi:hypothetical protein F4818DRAFT_416070 [Hypoxylon cercidicola]|nr:hypothetical protein F4818DRAFT_416070 [Hypoxylon cercidicola]
MEHGAWSRDRRQWSFFFFCFFFLASRLRMLSLLLLRPWALDPDHSTATCGRSAWQAWQRCSGPESDWTSDPQYVNG